MPGSLKEFDFQISYGPGDDRLHRFYIPALERSVRYDRSAGFFSSSALAVAAAGVARLIQNGGRMRLLVGAELSDEDVAAIEAGYDLAGRVSERLAILRDPGRTAATAAAGLADGGDGMLEIQSFCQRRMATSSARSPDYITPKRASSPTLQVTRYL